MLDPYATPMNPQRKAYLSNFCPHLLEYGAGNEATGTFYSGPKSGYSPGARMRAGACKKFPRATHLVCVEPYNIRHTVNTEHAWILFDLTSDNITSRSSSSDNSANLFSIIPDSLASSVFTSDKSDLQ